MFRQSWWFSHAREILITEGKSSFEHDIPSYSNAVLRKTSHNLVSSNSISPWRNIMLKLAFSFCNDSFTRMAKSPTLSNRSVCDTPQSVYLKKSWKFENSSLANVILVFFYFAVALNKFFHRYGIHLIRIHNSAAFESNVKSMPWTHVYFVSQ